MKLRITLAAVLAGAFAAPGAFAQPAVHETVRIVAPPMGEHGRRDWKFEHPVVVSHSQLRGVAGTKVVIRGHNFGKDLVVVWGGNPIPGATVTEDTVTFVVPKGAANGTVYLRGSGLPSDLAIGDYEVAAADAAAQKAEEDAIHSEAKAAWDERQAKIAADKAARDAALAQEEEQLETTREQRREAYYADLEKEFNHEFLRDPHTTAELALHAERLAKLQRIERLVASMNDPKLGARVELDIKREDKRHNRRMAALKAAFKGA